MSTIEFLQKKWHIWFRMMDINQDGVLTEVDWDLAAAKFVADSKVGSKEAEDARNIFKKWGNLIHGIGSNGIGALTEDEFVQNLSKKYLQNPDKTRKEVIEITKNLVEVCDVNHDGFVTEDEFVLKNCPFGWTEDQSRRLYPFIGEPGPLGINNQLVATHCSEFFMGDDEAGFEKMAALGLVPNVYRD